MKKRVLPMVLVLIIAMSFMACTPNNNNNGMGDTAQKGQYVLKVGTVLTEADPLYKGLESFKKNVEERTEGVVTVELYSGSQLGADEDVLEQAKVGAGVGVITDPGRMANYISDFGILGGPYIADDYESALELMETSVYKDFVQQFEDYGFKILSFNYFQGSRNLYTKSPVSKPEDLNGLRIRSSGSDVVTKSLEAMGSNTTVLPWSESYQGLQQKAIEGVEVHNSAAVGSSIFEVTDYVSLTGHFQLLTGLVISNSWFQKLPQEYQTILEEESFNAGKQASEIVIENDEDYLQQAIDGGVEVVDVDIEAFKSAAETTYDELGYRELKDKIDSELGR